MNEHTEFSIEIHQNEYLPAGGDEAEAIVTVTATGGERSGGENSRTAAAQIILLDCSGSMGPPGTKIEEAKQASAAAIDTLCDNVPFAVVAGTQRATVVYPGDHALAPATATSREEAKAAVNRLRATGGTAIGQWLAQTNRLFAEHQDKICHAILLTDGKNEYEDDENLNAALAACTGRFTCDARGVGADWNPDELRKIASELLGDWDLVRDPSQLEADFRAMARKAMRKAVTDVMLRLWTPRGATVRLVTQVEPTIEDLTSQRVESGTRSGDYPTGSWGDEVRRYHVRVRVNPALVGEEVLAARASIVMASSNGLDAEVLARGLVRAVWTDDPAQPGRIDPVVAHYTGQEKLHQAIQQALRARDHGELDAAAYWFLEALEHGRDLDRADTVQLVRTMFDPTTGAVRPKDEEEVERLDAIELDRSSSKTTPLR